MNNNTALTIRLSCSGRQYYLNGKKLNIKRSQKVRLHSTEFNHGYGGSGPAQLALAICLELFGEPADYQKFKFTHIGRLPQGQDFDKSITFNKADYQKTDHNELQKIHRPDNSGSL